MIQKINYEDVTVEVDMLNKRNEHGVKVIAVNESYGAVQEIHHRIKEYIKDKEYPLNLQQTSRIQDIIMNVIISTRNHIKPENVAIKIDTSGLHISKKPPIGLRPRKIVAELRIKEITEAMIRYANDNYIIPPEWITEYNELVEYLKENPKL